ncbi:MAG TPA: DMT family transporter, partial [Candidatus Thermoplasmatota archaeon]|nr:DMT family transporter [Candidatus Thermoplasmatota archaeon]
ALGDAGLGGIKATGPALYGDLLAFVGAIAAAAYFVSGRRLRRRLSLLVYVVPVYASCTLTLLVLALLRDAPLSGFAPRTWALFLLMAVFPGVGGHTLFNWCLRYVPAATVGTAILGEPLIATVLAALLYTEIPGPLGIIGGVLTLVGIVAVVRARAVPVPLPTS